MARSNSARGVRWQGVAFRRDVDMSDVEPFGLRQRRANDRRLLTGRAAQHDLRRTVVCATDDEEQWARSATLAGVPQPANVVVARLARGIGQHHLESELTAAQEQSGRLQ